MALKAIVDTLDGIDEQFHGLYVEQDGKFRLQIDGIEAHPAVAGLVENKRTILEEKRKLAEDLKGLDGIDPVKYREMLAAQEKQEHDRLEQKGEWEKLREQMTKKHTDAMDAEQTARETVMKKLRKVLVDNEATKVITSEEFKGNPTLLLPHLRDRVRVDESGDDFAVTVLQADGQTPLIADASGTPATIKDLIGEMREDPAFGQAFAATGASGTGSQNSGSNAARAGSKLAGGNDDAFIANLEDIASGKVVVEAVNPLE